MERRIGSIIIPETRDFIAQSRREPSACLYCANQPNTREHPLPEAMGGRLWAPILCDFHNGLVAAKADEPMILQLAPLVNLLGVRRQRGEHGTSFAGRTDSGAHVVVERDQHVRRHGLEVIEKNEHGKIKYAKGDLNKLDALKASGALADDKLPIIATLEKPPVVNFEIAVAHDAERGVLKIALHFVAGFVADVGRKAAIALLPYILGERVAGGEYVRTMPLAGRYFPESWPPMHEVRTYPVDDETFVMVLLFGLYGFQVRLPFRTAQPMRYLQRLVGAVDPILEHATQTRDFGWDERLTAEDRDSHHANLAFRHNNIVALAAYRSTQEQCKIAAVRARKSQRSFRIRFDEAYRSELQMETFSADEITALMHLGTVAVASGREPWNFTLNEFVSW